MDHVNKAINLIGEQLLEGSIIWIAVFGLLFVYSMIYFFRGLYIYSKRSVESAYFMIFCALVAVWAFLRASGAVFGWDIAPGTPIYVVIVAAGLLIPVLLMFHIWSQVSYRPITATVRFFWLVVPLALIVFTAFDVYDQEINFNILFYGQISLITLISHIYFLVVIVKSYLLCFNIFYQMPKHMRNSTYHMIIAITSLLVANVISIYFAVPDHIHDVIVAIAYIIATSVLCRAFFIANSSNVIVTSRDFVFSNLSTIVITVSLKGSILDWNKKDKGAFSPLPDPKYKEPYPLYRKRIIDVCKAAISPHDENIINIIGDNSETHFLFTWHEISYLGRKFGYLVEISEVTKIYTKLRYLEDSAFFDTLTSLHNRNAYIETVKEISSQDNMPLLILVGDVNNLKKINDNLGHLAGDKLLLVITGVIKSKAPEKAHVFRIGGDEIAMLVSNADEDVATTFINAVTDELSQINDPEIGRPSISWGWSIMDSISDNYNEVFRAADDIMYQEKKKAKEVSISGFVPSE